MRPNDGTLKYEQKNTKFGQRSKLTYAGLKTSLLSLVANADGSKRSSAGGMLTTTLLRVI